MQDSFIQIGQDDTTFEFYDVVKDFDTIISSLKNQKGANMLLIKRIHLSDVVMMHKRQVYSILDVFGDYGGVEYVLMILSAFIVAPFA